MSRPAPEHWARLKQLFHAAVDLPVAERDMFVARETAGDDVLQEELRSLLASHDTADGFLDPVQQDLREAALDVDAPTRAGERIGAYRLVELIGSGGMGDVYRAARADDQYQVEVAIKLMRPDVRNALSEVRFRTERQILAALDHRNIARLLDGGTSTQGLPYVVMELVSGQPIDAYCDERGLTIHERVHLFLQVCSAVSYAHQHLIVHRDLKPGNILVTTDGTVKLLDFGIAKLLEPEVSSTASTEATRTQLRAMTLEYASPEQVGGGAITTASDVYSLGVVLYRLLTGQSPYRARGNDAARVAEILGETSPTRPSEVEPRTRETIDADLDHVLLKALRKEPAKRYGTVQEFASDLRHFLAGLPVSARRGTRGYRLGKFVRRHRVPIAAATLVVLSMAVGLGVAVREARIANEQRLIAQRHFDNVRQLANAMIQDVYNEIDVLPGAGKARLKLAETAQRYLDELSRQAGGDAGLQVELAVAYRKLGDIRGGVNSPGGGDSALALANYARSIQLLEQVLAREPEHAMARVRLAASLMNHSMVMLRTQGPNGELEPARRAIELFTSTPDGFRGEFDRVQYVVNAFRHLADVYTALERPEEAIATYDQATAAIEEYMAAHAGDVDGLKLLRATYANAAFIVDPRWSKQQKYARVHTVAGKAAVVNDRLIALEPDSPEHVTRLAEMRLILADASFTADQFAEAAGQYRLAMPALARAAEDPADARAQLALAMCEAGLAAAAGRSGDVDTATRLFAAADRRLRALEQDDANNLYVRSTLAQVEVFRGELFVTLAEKTPASSRDDYRRQARASLRAGLDRLGKIAAQNSLGATEKDLVEVANQALARLNP